MTVIFHRRNFLRLAAGSAAMAAGPGIAVALDYPTRPVRMIVGLAAGGPTDVVARMVAQFLSERLGNQFAVENRTGAGGTLATETVINASADGYTLLFAGRTVPEQAARSPPRRSSMRRLTVTPFCSPAGPSPSARRFTRNSPMFSTN
jgi:tripartite-type tricarboxylate transporter receptor subunit TctC